MPSSLIHRDHDHHDTPISLRRSVHHIHHHEDYEDSLRLQQLPWHVNFRSKQRQKLFQMSNPLIERF